MVARTSLHVLLPAVGDESVDERPVELELGDCEAAQVGERGETGAEVVDRDAEAELAQLVDDLPAALEVTNDRGLGDLEDQADAGTRMPAQRACEQLR